MFRRVVEHLSGHLAEAPLRNAALRRHNHTGLTHALLKLLAKTNKLGTAKEGAKTKMTERREKAKAKGEAMDED